mmetsp:Transcript_31478/g.100749  ORF Transcript_31478/g.100749 Transcript_31478/m.100749 type:complete len:434 (+) Transcript_31478:1167-2468(+)
MASLRSRAGRDLHPRLRQGRGERRRYLACWPPFLRYRPVRGGHEAAAGQLGRLSQGERGRRSCLLVGDRLLRTGGGRRRDPRRAVGPSMERDRALPAQGSRHARGGGSHGVGLHVCGCLLAGLLLPAVPQQRVLELPGQRELGGLVRGAPGQLDLLRGPGQVRERVRMGLPGRRELREGLQREGRLRVARGGVHADGDGRDLRGAPRVPRRAVRRAGDHLLRDAGAVDRASIHTGISPRALQQQLPHHRRADLHGPHALHLRLRHSRRTLHALRHGGRVPGEASGAASQAVRRELGLQRGVRAGRSSGDAERGAAGDDLTGRDHHRGDGQRSLPPPHRRHDLHGEARREPLWARGSVRDRAEEEEAPVPRARAALDDGPLHCRRRHVDPGRLPPGGGQGRRNHREAKGLRAQRLPRALPDRRGGRGRRAAPAA